MGFLVDFTANEAYLLRLGSKKEHDPAILMVSSSSKHGRSANHEINEVQKKSKKACSSPASIVLLWKSLCRSVSQYHLLDAWRNSLDPAPKIGLLIAEEEGQNLSKSFVIHQVSIRYRTTQRCQRCFVSFSLLQSGAFFLLLLHFSIADWDQTFMITLQLLLVRWWMRHWQVHGLAVNALISIIYRRKFWSIIVPKGGDVPKPQDSLVVVWFLYLE